MHWLLRNALLNAFLAATTLAAAWPQWRGLDGSGVSPDTNAPLAWRWPPAGCSSAWARWASGTWPSA